MRKTTLIAAIGKLLIISCGGSDDNPEQLPRRDIYILGRAESSSTGDFPVIYRNGEFAGGGFGATPGKRVFPVEITVSEDSSVTVSANRFDGESEPVFATDNQLFFPDLGGGSSGRLRGHIEHNNTIHAYGNITNQDGDIQACYWVHQRLVLLESNFDNTEATGMAVVDGSIIVTGYAFVRNVGNIPLYWRDGELNQLRIGDSRGMYTNDIEVVGSDIYILGSGVNNNFEVIIGIWKNDQLTEYLRPEINMVTQDLELIGDEIRFDIAHSDPANLVGYYADGQDEIFESNMQFSFSVTDLEFSSNGDAFILGTVVNGSAIPTHRLYMNGEVMEIELGYNE